MIYKLYTQALNLSPNERENFVRSTCPDQETLDQVLLLLSADNTEFTLSSHLAEESDLYQQQIAPKIGDIISVYKLVEQLGIGGMGAVFKAERVDGTFEQIVAIKIISPLLYQSFDSNKLVNEANFMAKLNHSNICSVYDAGVTSEGIHYIVMEYIDGDEVSTYFTDATVTLKQKLTTFANLCEAVNYAHQMQVIHGDLKPANILITDTQQIKVLDFGISHIISPESSELKGEINFELKGISKGFSSPELINGEKPSIYSDVYALGHILATFIESAGIKSIPYQRELNAIKEKATASLPTGRYASVLELKHDIDFFITGHVVSTYTASTLYKLRKFTFVRHPVSVIVGFVFVLSLAALTINLAIQYQNLAKEKIQTDIMLEKFSLVLDLDFDKKSSVELSLANNYQSRGEIEKARVLYNKVISRFSQLEDSDLAFDAAARLLISFVKTKQTNLISSSLAPLINKLTFIAGTELPITPKQALFYHFWINASYERNNNDKSETYIKHSRLLEQIKTTYWSTYSNTEKHYIQYSIDLEQDLIEDNKIDESFYYKNKDSGLFETVKLYLQNLSTQYLDPKSRFTPSEQDIDTFLQAAPIFWNLTHYNNVESEQVNEASFAKGVMRIIGKEGIYKVKNNYLQISFGEGEEQDTIIYLSSSFAFSVTMTGGLLLLSHDNYISNNTNQAWVNQELANSTWYHIYDRAINNQEPNKSSLMEIKFTDNSALLILDGQSKLVPWRIKRGVLNLNMPLTDQTSLNIIKIYSDDNMIITRNQISGAFSIFSKNRELAEYIYKQWNLFYQTED